MEYPDWVVKYKTKGTAIEKRRDKYYLTKIRSQWDPKKGRAKKITEKYLGAITPQGLIPPKHERILQSITTGNITVKEYGATQYILDNNKSLTDLLKHHYPGSWEQILSLAIFRLIYNTTLKNAEFYYLTSYLSETVPQVDLSNRSIGEFIRTLGVDKGRMEGFLHEFVTGTEYLAVDLTHVFSLSENVISATIGHNGANDFSPQINLFYLFSLDKMMPAYFRIIVGSINSAKSLRLSIKESGAKNVVVIGDKGFYSKANVKDLETDHLHYIFPLKRDSSLISYDRIRKGDKREFGGYFKFEKRVVWHYDCMFAGDEVQEGEKRRLVVFVDDKLKTEEQKDALSRIDEVKDENVKRVKLNMFYENQYRMGTIAVVTDLNKSDEDLYGLLKARVDIEQMYDTFKNTLNADRSYMRDDYQMEGWMFINFVSMLLYYKIYNQLVERKLLGQYSPRDVLVHLSRIHKIRLGDKWVTSEVPKKTNHIIEKLGEHITKNLRS